MTNLQPGPAMDAAVAAAIGDTSQPPRPYSTDHEAADAAIWMLLDKHQDWTVSKGAFYPREPGVLYFARCLTDREHTWHLPLFGMDGEPDAPAICRTILAAIEREAQMTETKPTWDGEQPVTTEQRNADVRRAAKELLALLELALNGRRDGNLFVPLAELQAAMDKLAAMIALAESTI